MFSAFGYLLAKPRGVKQSEITAVAFLSAIALIFVGLLGDPKSSLDMQKNKFPPNHVFFLFSCFWVSVIICIYKIISRFNISICGRKIAKCILKPYVVYGYSMFMWQGLGYTVAVIIGNRLHLPKLVVWMFAIFCTLVLGKLASPVEKIRIGSSLNDRRV